MTGAVLFDVDGTLIDSNDLHAEAWREAFLHFDVDVPLDRIRGQIGKGGDNLIPALVPGLAEAYREEIETYRGELFKRDYLDRVRPFAGVRPLFERLHLDGIKIVLASSAGKEELDHHVELLGCADLLAATTSKDDVEHSKPDPDIFAAALAKVAPLAACDVLVVGDTPYDAEAARKVGIRMVGFRSGGFAEADLRAAGAALIFDGPQDLLRQYDLLFADTAATA